MNCPKCGDSDCEIISEVHTSGKDFSLSKGFCGAVLFGPTGILCGLCGEGSQTRSTNYWICKNCGKKWRA